jgi:hypothetical protein
MSIKGPEPSAAGATTAAQISTQSTSGPRYERQEYLPYEKSLDTAADMNQINQ